MGIFDKKSDEDKLAKKIEAIKLAEVKARGKASKKGFNVDGAIYVMEAMYPKDDDAKMNLHMPLVAIFEDKVVQSRKSLLMSSLEEIPMKNISSVEISTGLIPTVNVYTSGNTLTFRSDVLQGPKFVEVLRECLSNRPDIKATSSTSEVDQIEKLAALMERGLVTREEFEKKKQQILGL
jgi:hypothetical protein